MEYGEECWCGDIANVVPNGATLQAETDCNMPCSGNASQICGAGNRLSYYTWNSTLSEALYEWHYPAGNAAGEYQFYVSISGLICGEMNDLTVFHTDKIVRLPEWWCL
jgi:hypothetical protein